jgi:hypothetical protein
MKIAFFTLTPLPTQPSTTSLKAPYWSTPFSHIPSLWLAPFPHPLLHTAYISPLLPCLVTSAPKIETACFSKMLTSDSKPKTSSTWQFWCKLMSDNEHTFHSWIHMLAPTQLLLNWHEQRPSNKGDLDSSAMGNVAKVYCMGRTRFWLHFVLWYILLLGCVLNGTPSKLV